MLRFSSMLLAVALALVSVPGDAAAAAQKKAAKAATSKKSTKAEEKKADRPGDQKATTKGLEETLKKQDEADKTDEVRLAPAKLPTAPGKEVTTDELADKRRDEAIEQIKKILPKQKNPEVRADLLFQLAELWWEKSQFVRMKEEMPAFQAELDAWHQCRKEKGEKGCPSEPRPDNRKSELYRKNAVDLYAQIAKDYPKYKRVDEVVFILAYNKYDLCSGMEAGRAKDKVCGEAVEQYRRLISLYPKSPFVADAYVQLGNHYFDTNSLAPARKSFEECEKLKTPKTETYCIYKLAWCDINAGDNDMAIKRFKVVIERAEKEDDRIRLKAEALRDIIRPFSQIDAVDQAVSYFKAKAGKQGSRQYIKSLADVYFGAGKYGVAVNMFENVLLKENPDDSNAPEWQSKIVLSYDKLSKRDKVLDEMRKLVDRYRPGSRWWKVNSKPDGSRSPQQELALNLTEEALYNLVTDYHQEAIKTKSVATYRLARDIYREYIENFPDTERSYQMRYYYAEILYALEEYQAGYEQYRKVAIEKEQESFKKVAASNMLLAAEKLVDIEAGRYKISVDEKTKVIDEKKAKGDLEKKQIVKIDKNAQPEPLTDLEKQLVAACDLYGELVPDAEDESNVRLRAAVTFFDRVQYVEAAKRFGYIIKKWPAQETSATAASLILESLETKEEWLALNKLAREFNANQKLLAGGDAKKKAFREKLPVYIEGSQFKYAQVVNDVKKDYPTAAKLFRDFADEFPKSQYAPVGLYNAFVIYQRAKELDTAIAMGEKLIAEYPTVDKDDYIKFKNGTRRTNAEGKDLLLLPILKFDLAKTYELIADFPTAAKYYEAFAAEYKDDDRAPDAQFNAGLWFQGLGENEKAIAAFQKYIKVWEAKKPEDRTRLKLVDAAAVDFAIALIYEGQKDWKKEHDHLDGYIRKYKSEEAWKHQNARYKKMRAQIELAAKQPDIAKIAEEILKTNEGLAEADKTKPSSKQAAAHSRFYLLEPRFEAYRAIKFDSDRTLAAKLKEKTDAAAKLKADYEKVISDGNPEWAIAALVREAMLPKLFAKSLLEAPMPRNLDPDQQEIYRALLEEKALEYEAPAIEALELALSKSAEWGVYNEWVLEAQAMLAEFKPDLFQEIRTLPLRGSEFFFTGTVAAPAAGNGSGGDAP